MRNLIKRPELLAVLLFFVFNIQTVFTQEWTRFRGPNGTGVGNSDKIPVSWTEADLNWRISLPGRGHSSPVIWQETLFVTSADENTERGVLLAINTITGKMEWEKYFDWHDYRINSNNSYSSTTPAVDENNVYILWLGPEKSTLTAFTHLGEKRWERDFNGVLTRHGFGNSPVLFGDLIVFNLEQEEVKNSPHPSKWMAVNRKSGETAWSLKRKTVKSNSYSSPFLFQNAENSGELIFTSEAHGFTAVDLKSGKVLWSLENALDSRAIASPILAGDLIIGTCKSELIAVTPGSESKLPVIKYKLPNRLSPYVPTPIYHNGILFNFKDNGYISAIEASSGELLWREKPAGRYYGSPVLVNGNLYCMSREGEVVVLKAEREYNLLAVNPALEGSHATPAVAGGNMFLRTFSHLISIGK